jgi:shikimate dehydrogenase
MSQRKILSLAVIGDPVSHSLSPAMQNAALRALKLPYRYRAIRVPPRSLKSFMKQAAPKLAGFNVTIPHKVAIVPLLDRLAFEAKLIGAVNTVVHRNGEWIGFNTDGAGYLFSLQQDARFNPKGRRVTLLGAGGAAHALAFVLGLHRVKSLTLVNRHPKRAAELAVDLKKHFPKIEIQVCAWGEKLFATALKKTDLLINGTSVGLGGTAFENFPWRHLKKRALVSDIVYQPRWTPFLRAAKRRGHPIHTGEGMLVHQGALALEIWTGQKPDTGLMRRVLLKELKKREKKNSRS